MEVFAICAIFKNEAPYLAEWLAFHLAVGFDRFVLYDNGSTDGGRDVIAQLPFADRVTVIDWPQRPGQEAAYGHFFAHHLQYFDWAAYIDVDEFINPLEVGNIRDVATLAGDHPAMLINWLNFGPDGHTARPAGLVTENFTRRLPAQAAVNRHVKSLVRCNRQTIGAGPHIAALRGDPCDARGHTTRNLPILSAACHDNVVINHYYTRSYEDWLHKVARGNADVADTVRCRNPAWFDFYKDNATVLDERILRWGKGLKSWLQPEAHA